MSKVEKKLDATMDCGTCGLRLICRNKTYPAYEEGPERTVLQWQNDKGGAHYKCIEPGKFKCLDENGKDIPAKKKVEIPKGSGSQSNTENIKGKVGNGLVENDLMKDDDEPLVEPDPTKPLTTKLKTGTSMSGPILQPLDELTTPLIRNDALLLYKVRKVIIDTVSKLEKDPHPGMIWEMTAIIYKKHFGESNPGAI